MLGKKFQIVIDHRALQWLLNFKDPDGLTARSLEKLAAFEYEIVHRSGKSIYQAKMAHDAKVATTASLYARC